MGKTVRTAAIEIGRDGTFGIYTPDIVSSIIGEGATVAEAKADFENSVKEVIQSCKEMGEPVPDDLENVTFVYKYDLPSFFNYYPVINVSAFARTIGMNPSLLLQYKLGRAYISEKQMKKIEDGIHRLGSQLQEAQFTH